MPWGGFAAMLVALALVISPWTIRNYGTTGHFVPISSGTSDAFLRGLIFSRTEFVTLRDPPYTIAENESNAYFQRLAEEAGTVWQADDYETDEILNDEMWRVIREEPQEVVRKSFVGLFAFWYQLTSLKNSLLVLVCAIGAWALAIVGWRRARPRTDRRVAVPPSGVLPERRPGAAVGARSVLRPDPAGAARRVGVRRRHAPRSVASTVDLTAPNPSAGSRIGLLVRSSTDVAPPESAMTAR